jgi:hypothetical protein
VITFTIDMNCLIAIEKKEDAATDLLALVAAASAGTIGLAMVASAASERQRGGGFLGSIDAFRSRMDSLGFGPIELLKPIGKHDFSFYGHTIFPDEAGIARENEIFEALFPAHSASWEEYAAAHGVDVNDPSSKALGDWRNMLCDVQAFWGHEHYGRDHFVTTDKNFHRKLVLTKMIPDGVILSPADAVARLAER